VLAVHMIHSRERRGNSSAEKKQKGKTTAIVTLISILAC